MAADIDPKTEMRAHEGTYEVFLKLVKWGSIAAAIAALFVIWLIT